MMADTTTTPLPPLPVCPYCKQHPSVATGLPVSVVFTSVDEDGGVANIATDLSELATDLGDSLICDCEHNPSADRWTGEDLDATRQWLLRVAAKAAPELDVDL
jgi:hypothetical protein